MERAKPLRESRSRSLAAQMKSIPSCPVLYPTLKEFGDFFTFVCQIEKKYKHDFGMVKVVAPEGWRPHSGYSQNFIHELPVLNPIQQFASGQNGFYQAYLETKASMTLKQYMHKVCNNDQVADKLTNEQVETMVTFDQNQFWKNVNLAPPLYGADIQNSLMDDTAESWNLNKLDSLVKVAFGEEKCSGVNSCYLYVGSWKSFFAWHKEDLDLSAINFLHEGKSKFWYSVPPHQSELLESVAKKHFPDLNAKCQQFMRHKTTLINPQMLKKECPGLKISKMEHRPNEFILVFGGAYHTGFNFGFNIAEAINYATLHWLETVPDSKYCSCKKSSVKINLIELRNNLLRCKILIKTGPLATSKQFQTFTSKLQEIYGKEGKEAVSSIIISEAEEQKVEDTKKSKKHSFAETVVSYDDFMQDATELVDQLCNEDQSIIQE